MESIQELILLVRWNKSARTDNVKEAKKLLDSLEGLVNCTAYVIKVSSEMLDQFLKELKRSEVSP